MLKTAVTNADSYLMSGLRRPGVIDSIVVPATVVCSDLTACNALGTNATISCTSTP